MRQRGIRKGPLGSSVKVMRRPALAPEFRLSQIASKRPAAASQRHNEYARGTTFVHTNRVGREQVLLYAESTSRNDWMKWATICLNFGVCYVRSRAISGAVLFLDDCASHRRYGWLIRRLPRPQTYQRPHILLIARSVCVFGVGAGSH